jgi:hypothetical protein
MILRLACTSVLCIGILLGREVSAQRVTLATLKAAYVLNFCRFTDWPAMTPKPSSIGLCVINDWEVAGDLEQLVKGRRLGDIPYQVRRPTVSADLRSCHLVYASGLDGTALTVLLEAVKGAAVLTLSDAPLFAEQGGVANFYVQGETLRFAVNLAAAQRAQLKLSSRLLSIGTFVKDQAAGPFR